MYYPIGLPRKLTVPSDHGLIESVVCNRDRNLFCILTEEALWIWYNRPCLPVCGLRRSAESLELFGQNVMVEWRPDSSMVVVGTSNSKLLFYSLNVTDRTQQVYQQNDSSTPGLKRDSAELFTKETIPALSITQTKVFDVRGGISCIVCLRDELMVATGNGHIQRLRWDGSLHYDYCIDLSRVPFCDDQLVIQAVPLTTPGVYVSSLSYSPLVGGFASVLSDGRAAFLTASTLQFDPNAVQGIWARDLDDATSTSINHKYRLLAYGRSNGEGIVYQIDESTGGLEVTHKLALSSRDFAGDPGPVGFMRWSPDGTVLALGWKRGGFSLWSVFGSLLTSSLKWDYSEDPLSKPIGISCMEWGTEGYEAWCVQTVSPTPTPPPVVGSLMLSTTPPGMGDMVDKVEEPISTNLLMFSFVKSALTVNPSMSSHQRILLQSSDKLFISCPDDTPPPPSPSTPLGDNFSDFGEEEGKEEVHTESPTGTNKQWLVVPIPFSYTAANFPIRYVCADASCTMLAVAGRNGMTHYSVKQRKWHLFGNETQEEDFVVTGGMVWWRGGTHLVVGAYNIPANCDEIRLYSQQHKLDDQYSTVVKLSSQVLLLNIYGDLLVALTANCHITVYHLSIPDTARVSESGVVVSRVQEVDISGLAVHPACVVSIALTSLRTESPRLMPDATPGANYYSKSRHPLLSSSSSISCSPTELPPPSPPAQSLIFNISGKVLMIQRDKTDDTEQHIDSNTKLFQHTQMTPIVLASCCESLWCSNSSNTSLKPHLSHALWLHCGAHGVRAWLPLFPNSNDQSHTFLARRIMLPVAPSIYPLAVLFEEGILVGAETDTSLVGCDGSSLHQPSVLINRTSQVYLQDILRQLLRRNLGYHAWEVASTCQSLPHFPHALELLLHQVLEEEATSKEPLPDSLLPRVLEFIKEFPRHHLQTVVRCARKTELPLWRFLFSVAGSPSELFCEALACRQLDTAASYLIILQNLESSSASRSHASRLLDATLDACKWQLCKDLIRFLNAIDPTDLDSPKVSSQLPPSSTTPPPSPSQPHKGGSTRVGFTSGASQSQGALTPACVDEDVCMVMPSTQLLRRPSAKVLRVPQALRGRSYSNNTSGGKSFSPGGAAPQETPSTPPRPQKNEAKRSNSESEEYFVNFILQRHAKKLLQSGRLHLLGIMAARLDFPVVSWLRKERCRAARVEDFVSALKQVHIEFGWPYPSVPANTLHQYSLTENNVEDSIRQLSLSMSKVASITGNKMGDSGYLSQTTTGETLTPQHHPGGPYAPLPTRCSLPDISSDMVVRQAMLLPRQNAGDLVSVVSGGSSIYGDSRSIYGSAQHYTDPTRDLITRSPDPPLSQTPSPQAEVKLRYLLQVFQEAGCLEWAGVISVVLRDAMAIVRLVTAAKDAPLASLARLSLGLQAFSLFTHSHCLGYQSFMVTINQQLIILQKILSSREKLQIQNNQTNDSKTKPSNTTEPNNRSRSAIGHHEISGNQSQSSSHPPTVQSTQSKQSANRQLSRQNSSANENGAVNSKAERVDDKKRTLSSSSFNSSNSVKDIASSVSSTPDSTGCSIS